MVAFEVALIVVFLGIVISDMKEKFVVFLGNETFSRALSAGMPLWIVGISPKRVVGLRSANRRRGRSMRQRPWWWCVGVRHRWGRKRMEWCRWLGHVASRINR